MFSIIKRFGVAALATSLVVGCASFNEEDIVVTEAQNASAAKIINSSRSAEGGSLLIKFNESATIAFENAKAGADVVTRSGIEPLNVALHKIGATSIERLFPVDMRHEERTRKAGLHRWYIVRFDSNEQLEEAAKSLAEIQEVTTVQYNSIISYEPSSVVEADVNPSTRSMLVEAVNDPFFKDQWHYYNTGSGIHEKQVAGMDVNVKEAWRHCTGDPEIIVAVIDLGVDYTHEDLAANMWTNSGEIANNGIDDDHNGYVDDIHGYNHASKDGKISCGDGHGTHVAGTIAAVNNNGKGVCGIAGGDGSSKGVKIMSSQSFGDESGSIDISARAIKYAADNGAVIAQCSWGSKSGTHKSDKQFKLAAGVEYDAIIYFQGVKNSEVIGGGLVIFAAGNDGDEVDVPVPGYPGAYRDFISVTATGCDGMPAFYTNYGPGANIAAPGGDMKRHGNKGGVLSTLPTTVAKSGYGYMQGTSMACPHVSGVAALGLSYAKKLGKTFTLEEFTSMLLLSVDNIDARMANTDFAENYIGKMGTGSVNTLRMLMNVEGVPCVNVPKGQLAMIDLRPYLGDGTLDIVVRDNLDSTTIMSEEDKARLGVTNGPRISNNKLIITCENTGHGYIDVSYIAGGKEAGYDEGMGGRVSTKRLAIIVRDGHTSNGGWM